MWKTENTPYLKAIMDSFTDKTTQVITFLKPSQVGATEAGINICGYVVDASPSRVFYVMPNDDVAKDFSTGRLQKALRNTPSIAKKLGQTNKSKALMLRFNGGFIKLTGANSPSKLASWAIPRVIMDEVDKYPQWTGREASPISLIMERTKNWAWRKILIMSTPTTENGNVYKSYENAEQHFTFYIPCVECGHYQELVFNQLKFPNTLNDAELAQETYYECIKCKHHMTDRDKLISLKKGKWIADEKLAMKPKTVAYRLNTLYSPWVRIYEVAREFLKSKDDPTALMNFVNSWLGEPWKTKVASVKSRAVVEHKTSVPCGIVPKGTFMLTGGVDVQQGYFYWVIRAWQNNGRSQKIANGSAMTFDDVRNIMDKYWDMESSDKKMQVVLYAIDSGYNTQAVYDFCYSNFPVTIPVKGLSTDIAGYYRRKSLLPQDYGNTWATPQNLYEVDTNKYKDLIAYRLSKGVNEDGSWNVDADTDDEYASMITSEQKVLLQNGREVWQQIGKRPNHYLDCEVYAYLAADVLNVRIYKDGEEIQPMNTIDGETGEVT